MIAEDRLPVIVRLAHFVSATGLIRVLTRPQGTDGVVAAEQVEQGTQGRSPL
jgi:hypothetical protein